MKGYVKTDTSRRRLDWSTARAVDFPNLKPSSTSISLRVPDAILSKIKVKAHRRGMPYRSYLKHVLAEAAESA
jgi:predicted DNA binding CopG/RHH family protein